MRSFRWQREPPSFASDRIAAAGKHWFKSSRRLLVGFPTLDQAAHPVAVTRALQTAVIFSGPTLPMKCFNLQSEDEQFLSGRDGDMLLAVEGE